MAAQEEGDWPATGAYWENPPPSPSVLGAFGQPRNSRGIQCPASEVGVGAPPHQLTVMMEWVSVWEGSGNTGSPPTSVLVRFWKLSTGISCFVDSVLPQC